jgi:long-chain acyl-CoA synthetase
MEAEDQAVVAFEAPTKGVRCTWKRGVARPVRRLEHRSRDPHRLRYGERDVEVDVANIAGAVAQIEGDLCGAGGRRGDSDGIPVANGYGLTEAGTALTLNDFKPFRADTVGRPLPGVELRVLSPDSEGIGEVSVHSKTVMSHYLDDPELTAETIVDGWLLTGDLGRFDFTGHLQLFGRKKNMIVTEGGKNIYPEDIESVFDGLPVKEFCVFAANYLWPAKQLGKESLVMVLRLDQNQQIDAALIDEMNERNRRLADFKRIGGYLVWDRDFPRTASLKIKRTLLAEEIGKSAERTAVVQL